MDQVGAKVTQSPNTQPLRTPFIPTPPFPLFKKWRRIVVSDRRPFGGQPARPSIHAGKAADTDLAATTSGTQKTCLLRHTHFHTTQFARVTGNQDVFAG